MDVPRDGHLLLREIGKLGVHPLVASLCRDFLVSHHEQNFDETSDSCSGLCMTDVTLDGTEVEKGISLRPSEGVEDTADLDRIANTGYIEMSGSHQKQIYSLNILLE